MSHFFTIAEVRRMEDLFISGLARADFSLSRIFVGERLSVPVLAWLNADPQRASVRRVVRLLDLIEEYHSLAVTDGEWHAEHQRTLLREGLIARLSSGKFYWEGRLLQGWPCYPNGLGSGSGEKINAIGEKIRKLISQYRLVPDLAFGWGENLLFSWNAAPNSFGSQPESYRMYEEDYPFDEATAVMRVIQLCHEGFIQRLRNCGACKSWFYAKFSHQKFCSKRCQQKSYRSSPDWLEHRRKYMQRLRRMHKERIFKSTHPARTRATKSGKTK